MSSDNNLTNSPAVKAINHECDRTLTLSLYHPSVFMTIFIIIISTNRSTSMLFTSYLYVCLSIYHLFLPLDWPSSACMNKKLV